MKRQCRNCNGIGYLIDAESKEEFNCLDCYGKGEVDDNYPEPTEYQYDFFKTH